MVEAVPILPIREINNYYGCMIDFENREIKGVLFDLDGTLLDTYNLILASMRHAINNVSGGSYSDAELMARVGTPLADQMLYFADGSQEGADRLMEIYRQHNDSIHDKGICAFSDTAASLQRLQDAGLKLGVVTSKRHDSAQRGLDKTGIAKYFDVVIGPDDWPEHKPHPGPVLHGCKMIDVAPENCIYVGDSPFDIQAGNGAGCLTVAALWGMFPKDALDAQNPSINCESLSQLCDLLLD